MKGKVFFFFFFFSLFNLNTINNKIGGKGTFEEEFHKKRRRTIEPAFQLKYLKQLSPLILGPSKRKNYLS